MTWFSQLAIWLAVLVFAVWIIRKETQELREVRRFRRQLDNHDNNHDNNHQENQ